MIELARVFLDICLRRRGPEDLPASAFLRNVVLGLFVLTQLPVTLLAYDSPGQALLTVVADLVTLLLALWALLYFTGHAGRFTQTMTAVLGAGTLLTVLALPFNLASRSAATTGDPPGLASIVVLGIVLWSVVVDGHILSRALSRPFAIGFVIAAAYFWLRAVLLFDLAARPA